jgi:hypothetical protein
VIVKKLKCYFVNKKIKSLNRQLTQASDISSYLRLENQRLDLITKLNNIRKAK